MFFKRSLIALLLCGGMVACDTNTSSQATFFVPRADTPIAAGGPTWNIAGMWGGRGVGGPAAQLTGDSFTGAGVTNIASQSQ